MYIVYLYCACAKKSSVESEVQSHTHTRGATNTTACIVQYSMEQLGAVCAYYSFTAGSEAEGCAVELESEAHTHLFNMSRSTSGGGELSESVLDCFTVGGAGGYSVHVYEIQCGELRQRSRIALDSACDMDNSTGADKSKAIDVSLRDYTLITFSIAPSCGHLSSGVQSDSEWCIWWWPSPFVLSLHETED